MIKLRPEQKDLAYAGVEILTKLKIVYLAMEMRTGKTMTALAIAARYCYDNPTYKNVFFVTKKKAIGSIKEDYNKYDFYVWFKLRVLNYEQLHKWVVDANTIVIVDEAHTLGKYPKPALRAKQLKKIITSDMPLILMSGTPTPESYSQLYHQFWISPNSPFKLWKSFYIWARSEEMFVDKKEKYVVRGMNVTDYSDADQEKIMQYCGGHFLKLSQKEAGFSSVIVEKIHNVPTPANIQKLMTILLRDKVYIMKNGEEIICDTPVKLQQKFHQLSSGTIKTESEKRFILEDFKAEYIKRFFEGKKIAIFYKFIGEGNLLRQTFPNHTDSPELFRDNNHLTFISHVISGREGINLSTADSLVMFNIDFASLSYFQAKERIQDKFRKSNPSLHWIFSTHGIEKKIYKMVVKKKDYTSYYFKRDYGIGKSNTEKNHQASSQLRLDST